MKKFIVGLMFLVSFSALAGVEENAIEVKAKLVAAINASVSFEITSNDLNDVSLNIAAYSDRFHREIAGG